MTRPTSARRKALAGLTATALAAGGAALLAPGTGTASSHREAPLTAANPLVDNTDVYAFVNPDRPMYTTLIANWIPFQEPAGGPNFYPFGADGYRYNIKVDNDGDAIPDITYRWTFTDIDKRDLKTFLYNDGPVDSWGDPNLLFKQTYVLDAIYEDGRTEQLVQKAKVAPSYVGTASMPNYAALRDESITRIKGGQGSLSFAGQADDPFFLDLRVFDLLYGTNLKETGNDTLTRYNVNSIALQVPTANLTQGGDGTGVVGVWSTTDQQTMQLGKGTSTPTGEFVQVSRLGSPLVNEVVIPAGLKDAFNSLNPDEDRTVQAAVDRVLDPEVPKLIEAIYGIEAPAAPREDLVAAFLTGIEGLNQPKNVVPAEMLRLNTGIKPSMTPNRLGVLGGDTAGFPNGRRLADDVVDIELQALEGAIRTGEIVEPLAAGDRVDANDKAFGKTFPFLALPTSGSSTQPRGSSVAGGPGAAEASSAVAPSGAVAAGTGTPSGLPVAPAGLGLLGVAVLGASVLVVRRRSASSGETV